VHTFSTILHCKLPPAGKTTVSRTGGGIIGGNIGPEGTILGIIGGIICGNGIVLDGCCGG